MSRRFLICGAGSIGERHMRNLMHLGYDDLVLYRRRGGGLRTIDRTFPSYSDLDAALAAKPFAAVIANPSHLHRDTALACARAGCHLLIEKPVSHELADLDQLESVVSAQGVTCVVGYMMRFHPVLQALKRRIADGAIGPPVFARTQWGEYLPDWHPWEDWRYSYAARRGMGGGPTLTLSHEIDTLAWLFGEAHVAGAQAFQAQALELDCDAGMDILTRHPGGVAGNIHLDYVQRPPSRTTTIGGEAGRATFDFYAGRGWVDRHGASETEIIDVPEGFDRNDLFLDELRAFIDAAEAGRAMAPGLEAGRHALSVALAAERLAGSHRGREVA